MLVGMMALGAMAQKGIFTVRGNFEGVGDSVFLCIVHAFMSKGLPVTGQMMEEKFNLDMADEIVIGRWFLGREDDEDGDVKLPAIPGETLVVEKISKGKAQFSGSQFYQDYSEALKSTEKAERAVKRFERKLGLRMMMGASEDEVKEDLKTTYPALVQEYVDAVMEYVKAHPDQDASAALIAKLPEDVDYIEAAVALLTDRVRNGVAATLYQPNLKLAKDRANEEALRHALEGSTAPDFTLNDINGKPLALSSLRGKWVVVDFWGSWCGWCIKGIPQMKEYYAKYGDKLEILGVDCNDTVEKWKGAVEKHELPWLHVYCDMEDENSDDPLELYSVRGFPTKVVVDPEGKVAKIFVGEDPAFYDLLDEVLK